MKTSCLFACVVVLAASDSSTRGDEKSHRQAAEELLRTLKIDVQMQATIDQTLAAQIKTQPALAPYKDVMRKFFGKHISFAALKDDFIQIYVDEFTEAELRQTTAFYKTPAGKKMVEKGPTLMAKGMQLGMKRVAKHEDELRKMIEDEIRKQEKKP